MSEYQYYEFRAVDRPLAEGARKALRQVSTRARITATSFTNSYEWGDFKGDPAKFMEQWFDLHLYLANWGTRRLMVRVPERLMDRKRLDMLLQGVEWVELKTAGGNLIIDILLDAEDGGDWDSGSDWHDETELDGDQDYGSRWLAAMAPLRADLLAGDLRLFYLVWLMAVEADLFEPDRTEPLPGIGPMTEAIEAFANFFGLDPDIVQAAAERPTDAAASSLPGAARRTVEAMSGSEKDDLILRLIDGDPYVASELQGRVRANLSSANGRLAQAPRTIGELRSRAEAIRLARKQEEARAAAARRQKQAEEAERERRARLRAIERRGDSVWKDIEAEIERRHASSYAKAAGLLVDLRSIAGERGTLADFGRRLQSIRERHAGKARFIERLLALE